MSVVTPDVMDALRRAPEKPGTSFSLLAVGPFIGPCVFTSIVRFAPDPYVVGDTTPDFRKIVRSVVRRWDQETEVADREARGEIL